MDSVNPHRLTVVPHRQFPSYLPADNKSINNFLGNKGTNLCLAEVSVVAIIVASGRLGFHCFIVFISTCDVQYCAKYHA